MAKTKKKIAEKIKEKVEEVKVQMDRLEASHLLVLEIGQRDIENSKLLMAVEEQSLKNMLLEHLLLERKIEKQKQVVAQRASAYEMEKSKFSTKKKEIWPQYGLGENDPMGYDSVSGDIVRDPKK